MTRDEKAKELAAKLRFHAQRAAQMRVELALHKEARERDIMGHEVAMEEALVELKRLASIEVLKDLGGEEVAP